jgi:post-segregation antitoxin (ccd killing protein)
MKYLIQVPHGNCHNKTETKTAVSLYLSRNPVERAKNRSLNFSKIMEQALSSILDYIETENIKTGSEFLTEGSFPKKPLGRVDQPGMIATLASWRSRVQIPARPLNFLLR